MVWLLSLGSYTGRDREPSEISDLIAGKLFLLTYATYSDIISFMVNGTDTKEITEKVDKSNMSNTTTAVKKVKKGDNNTTGQANAEARLIASGIKWDATETGRLGLACIIYRNASKMVAIFDPGSRVVFVY